MGTKGGLHWGWRVMDSALTLHSWCVAAGEQRSPEGTCRAVASPAGTGRLSQFLGKGQMCGDGGGGRDRAAGGAVGLPGSVWESARVCPVPSSLPGWVLASPGGYGSARSLAVSPALPGEQVPAAVWGAASGSWQAPEPPRGGQRHQAPQRPDVGGVAAEVTHPVVTAEPFSVCRWGCPLCARSREGTGGQVARDTPCTCL